MPGRSLRAGSQVVNRPHILPAVLPGFGDSTSDPMKQIADVAQLVEQLIRNQQVIGSSPIVGSIYSI